MKLPNKITSYNSSVLSKFLVVLNCLESADLTPIELYRKTKKNFSSISEFYETLDCLYALGAIELTIPKDVLHYVDRNLL